MTPTTDFTLGAVDRERLRLKHPDSVPIYITRAANSKNTPAIRKNKFLVPADYTVANVICVIRKYINIGPEQGLFVFVDNHVPPPMLTIKELEQINRPKDGLLRFTYILENTFG